MRAFSYAKKRENDMGENPKVTFNAEIIEAVKELNISTAASVKASQSRGQAQWLLLSTCVLWYSVNVPAGTKRASTKSKGGIINRKIGAQLTKILEDAGCELNQTVANVRSLAGRIHFDKKLCVDVACTDDVEKSLELAGLKSYNKVAQYFTTSAENALKIKQMVDGWSPAKCQAVLFCISERKVELPAVLKNAA